MNAVVTFKCVITNVCDEKDLEDTTFQELVQYLIEEEGLLSLIDEEPQILKIEEDKS